MALWRTFNKNHLKTIFHISESISSNYKSKSPDSREQLLQPPWTKIKVGNPMDSFWHADGYMGCSVLEFAQYFKEFTAYFSSFT